MPHKDPEVRKEYAHRRYLKKKEEFKRLARERYHGDKENIRKRRLELAYKHRLKNNERERERYVQWRCEAFAAYGGACACCGETEPLFLEFDHINNDGSGHRKKIGTSAKAMVKWLKDNNYPPEFQILCANCNQGKRRNGGTCPHKSKKDRFCSQEI
uniref:Putative HNH endonuclease n=1 Tax=viral metagenome TaxID=1070528 RepID=A0A6M3JL75_9ZZZZ